MTRNRELTIFLFGNFMACCLGLIPSIAFLSYYIHPYGFYSYKGVYFILIGIVIMTIVSYYFLSKKLKNIPNSVSFKHFVLKACKPQLVLIVCSTIGILYTLYVCDFNLSEYLDAILFLFN
jgi:hypothetical protein